MDRWSGKRAIEARPDSKKAAGVVLRDRGFNSNICSDEKKSMKFTRFVGSSYKKEKAVWSSSRSSTNGKELIGTSSKIPVSSSSSSVKNEKQPQIAIDSSESSKGSEDEVETEILEEPRIHNGKVVESSDLPSSSRTKKGFRERFGLSKQEFRPGPSSQSTNRGCSPLLSGFGLEKRLGGKKIDTLSKRRVYGESSSSSSSSSRGKKIVSELPSEERRLAFNPRGGSVSDTRRARHCILNDVASVGGQRSSVNRGDSRIRFSNRGSGRNGLSSITTREMSQTETSSNNLNSPVSLELFSGFPDFGSLSSQDSFRNYNLDGISEILPELDRIEQDIELNYEELLIMETGLLLGGLSFYDQHRDMRLDIDNMSYEELLALEERIGTVSTGLTEEAVSKSLKTSIYQIKTSSDHKEDAKCSICQEEYTIGDELGRLHCEHTYHLKCVQEWLRMKSWCPICKTAAETSSK